jgi:hypothetical protein
LDVHANIGLCNSWFDKRTTISLVQFHWSMAFNLWMDDNELYFGEWYIALIHLHFIFVFVNTIQTYYVPSTFDWALLSKPYIPWSHQQLMFWNFFSHTSPSRKDRVDLPSSKSNQVLNLSLSYTMIGISFDPLWNTLLKLVT